MQFENFDNKVRQAAEQHHPNYDERAWSKMEDLLDKHLPQKDDRRRRIIFFLLLFLLLGGGAWLLIDKPWQPGNLANKENGIQQKVAGEPSVVTGKKETDKVLPGNSHADAHPDELQRNDINKNTDAVIKDNANVGSVALVNVNKQGNQVPGKTKKQGAESNFEVETEQGNIAGKKKSTDNVQHVDTEKKNPGSLESSSVVSSSVSSDNVKTGEGNNKNDQPVLSANSTAEENKTSSLQKDNAAEQPKVEAEKNIPKKERSKKASTFFFSLSAGPDISSVDPGNPGEVKLMTGAGAGYTIKERLTIRTGFYAVSKVYSASPDQYKPSPPLPNPNYLSDISADCKVYEIPLSLAYNFGRSAKHKTFASVGLSTLVMKKETYDYVYYYPGNPTPYPHTLTINNGSKHYFSILTLSGGYQRRINKTFSVAAEPYIKLPLAGIGFGNVKLNSAGILFSVSISPFTPAAKK
ncbi:MAG TPA: hypothetical protein VIZ28_00770 [Chitinophagaceae bacterium]